MRRDQGGMNWDGRRRKPPRSVVFIAFENRAIWLDDNFPIWQMVMRRMRVWARELKAWHGVHYLLCGDIEPGSAIPSQAVMGGVELGEDLGYGPARYFETGKVNQIAQALSAANLEAEMIARFDPVKMTSLGIYPGGWNAGNVDWLMEEFRRLRQFYADTSAAKLAIVTSLE